MTRKTHPTHTDDKGNTVDAGRYEEWGPRVEPSRCDGTCSLCLERKAKEESTG